MLQISIKTFEKHRTNAFAKLRVVSAMAAVRVALREERVGLDVFFASREGEISLPQLGRYHQQIALL
jgi:hypothetical protein